MKCFGLAGVFAGVPALWSGTVQIPKYTTIKYHTNKFLIFLIKHFAH